jgi:hypothetical protein
MLVGKQTGEKSEHFTKSRENLINCWIASEDVSCPPFSFLHFEKCSSCVFKN